MALSEGDKNTCREMAREIIKEVMVEHLNNHPHISGLTAKNIEKILNEHIKNCPHGIALKVSRAFVAGMIIASGLSGGAVGAIITTLLKT